MEGRVFVQRYFSTSTSRFLFQLVLFTIFLYFFGLPAVEKYCRKEVILVETIKNEDGIHAPAITIALPDQLEEDVFERCNTSIEACIMASTFNSTNIIKSVLLGWVGRLSLNLTKGILSEDFNQIWAGRYFTINLPMQIGSDDDEDQLYIVLYPQFVYQIFVHDPEFFIYNENPTTIPQMNKYFDAKNTKSHYYRLDLTEMHELDIPNDPCNPNSDYNFHECVKASVAKQVSTTSHITSKGLLKTSVWVSGLVGG